jgi:hypothetical protein
MNWKSSQTWLLVGAVALALFAIYTFASPDTMLQPVASPQENLQTTSAGRTSSRAQATPRVERIPGIEPLRTDLLEPVSATFRSGRNIFAFVEPPPPPPPAPPPPPPDKDKDGIPDFQDNCPGLANPDQTDIDRNGVGAACQEGNEIPPPPPPPQPPAFNYKYLGTFGSASRPIATFSSNGEIVNVRVGETFGNGRFTLRKIGIESVDIGFPGFPADVTRRIPLGQ